MRILIDEMNDEWDTLLADQGYDARSVKKLRRQGHDLADDLDVIKYAQANGMILITKDKRCSRRCEMLEVPCILLDDVKLFRVLLEELRRRAPISPRTCESRAYPWPGPANHYI